MPDQSVTASHEQDAASASSSTKKPSLGRVIAAWGVHLFTISGQKVLVMKPITYMNLSGEAVPGAPPRRTGSYR